ncbi:HAMP domain-containing sensor histidine kinase [Halalkalibacter kiskunsagensis]|uniref:histidine kinase n=1 Tax=Halalkalibacter kiskunsagensis TaxID=1548599 RepID=A0ABV6KJ61_9BACI
MDTKWKNRAKVLGWLVLFTLGVSGLLSGCNQGFGYMTKNYFQTDQFTYQYEDFVDQLSVFELNQMTMEEAIAVLTVSEDEVNEHRYRYGDLGEQIANIQRQYEGRIQNALDAENEEVAEAYTTERDQKIDDITKNFTDDDHIREKIIEEKEKRVEEYFKEKEQSRSSFIRTESGFYYYLRDIHTGEIYTNVTLESDEINNFFSSRETLFMQNYPSEQQGYLTTDRYHMFMDDELAYILSEEVRTYEGKIAVPKSVEGNNPIVSSYQDFQQIKRNYYLYTIAGGVAFLVSLFIYRRNPIINRVKLSKWRPYYSRIPLDVKLFILLMSVFLTMNRLSYLNHIPYQSTNGFIQVRDLLIDLSIATIVLTVTLMQLFFLYDLLKDKSQIATEWNRSFTNRSYRAIQEAFLNRSTGFQMLVLLASVFVFGAGAVLVLLNPIILIPYSFSFFVVGIPTLIIIVKRIGYFNRIVENTNVLAKGSFTEDLPIQGKSVLANLARDINTLKYGVKTSKKEQAKSERLKTELITNVSHDLRTPLTSIITYTELLKAPDICEGDKEAYIQIIDRKSKRLKVLIDDLFEASKMVSGNIELVKERVDIVQLLQQALAEHNEKIDESTLQFRVSAPEPPVHVIVDGQKLWRVFDNLIVNILHYSLENTRVYISVKADENKVVITFKNVTKYELGDNVDELYERFKRGDASRHTEGSGLGLAIAKSIIDLHGGSLDIKVDGDLFKVIVAIER